MDTIEVHPVFLAFTNSLLNVYSKSNLHVYKESTKFLVVGAHRVMRGLLRAC